MKDNNLNKMDDKAAKYLQGMLDSSISGIIILEPLYAAGESIEDFVVRAANNAIKDHIGIEPKDAIDKRMSEVVPQYKQDGFFDVYVNALTTKQVQRHELAYKDSRIDGWYEIGVAPNDQGIVVTFANISKYKVYQQQIETSARRLDAIINTSQSGIFLFSPVIVENGALVDFIFTKANPALANYVGQCEEVIIGGTGSQWFPAYKTNGLFELYADTWLTGKTNRFDFHYDADGIDVWLDILSTKLGNEVLVTFTDFTPIKRLQLELEKSVNDLKRTNENLEEFAYVASHDLQEPLRKIQYFGDRLKLLLADNSNAENFIDRLQNAVMRMRTLIEDLLSYSRFSSRRNPLEKVDLNELVHDVLNDLETSVNEKKPEITINALPVLNSDKLQLRQLFQNIISNALKYNRAGVPLKIGISSKLVSGSLFPHVVAQNEAHKNFHLIEVSDNGIGFDPAYATRIFKIFQRLHGRSEYPGTGVGLAIVQKVVENHEGYVFAESTPGEGSTFKILFPA